MHVRHRDRALQRWRPGGAGDLANFLAVGADDRTLVRRDIFVLDQPDELSRDAAVTAVQHSDDDFLSDVTTLREADGARFDAGFERNRLLVHVLVKLRYAGFDP